MLVGARLRASRGSGRRDASGASKEHRARLLADLEELERARAAGDIGPKTYERARRELVDAIARTLAASDKRGDKLRDQRLRR